MEYKSAEFDTVFDTKNIYVTIKTSFYVRKEKSDTRLSPLYLSLTASGKRERINLKISIDPTKWDKDKQRLKVLSKLDQDINLIIDNIQAKVTNINTVYRLSNKQITPALMRKELTEELPRVNFCSFFKKALEDDKLMIKPGTLRRYKAVLSKLIDYRQEIYFTEIDHSFFVEYRRYLTGKGNKSTTINSNFKVIKKYLRVAERFGIKLKINIDDVIVGDTKGNRTSLNLAELKLLVKYYKSEWILEHHKLTLGYFLFSCFTSLRISDVMNLTRKDVLNDLEFVSVKASKNQTIQLNSSAIDIIKENPNLFIEFTHPNVINRQLKDIAKILGITRKKISFHVSRHTFATSFLRMGGNVTKLQKLMGHSKLETTMIYVHILAEEANEEIYLLDNIFNSEGKRRDTKGN
ncbi:hypothetical protein HMPREF9715_00879 [Myroides odoratimimus CIP 101113]|uniref:Tyr recombinase domain-containing protein n=1 Tax=Myroides odoratimimus CIP 101113 TaxID=883154 RepID=A0AAV3F500_9FLAO|nr:hypothetical protein HMPREF9715_00879 [Myroides odoratimimus CIP 101113]